MARRARRRREEVRRAPPRLQQAVLPRPQWRGQNRPFRRRVRRGGARRLAMAGHRSAPTVATRRTEPASPYLLLQDRGAGAPEGGQMAAFPEGRRRTRSRLSRPMSQRARFDAPRRRFVRRTRATTRRPHEPRDRQQQKRRGPAPDPRQASKPARAQTHPDWTPEKPTARICDDARDTTCRLRRPHVSAGVQLLHPAPGPCRRTAENSRPGGQSAADSDRARWRAQARRHAACGNCSR